jgi:hypothetical protein
METQDVNTNGEQRHDHVADLESRDCRTGCGINVPNPVLYLKCRTGLIVCIVLCDSYGYRQFLLKFRTRCDSRCTGPGSLLKYRTGFWSCRLPGERVGASAFGHHQELLVWTKRRL